VGKSVNFIDTRAMKFIKKDSVITVLIIVIVCNVFRYLSNSQSPKNKLINNYRFVRKSSA